ncbi:MAG: hypothetical protein IPL53_14085 [Ignavibacteria bacterium]|nr:hypothetical protein [Ignavibacteria bacterium]
MLKIKSTITAVMVMLLSIMTGCSDQIVSPFSQSTGPDAVSNAPGIKKNPDVFYSKITLKPRQAFTYSHKNTVFSSFNSISILNCGDAKSSVEILGYLNDVVMVLGCNSKGFIANSITIENKTQNSVELDVFLTGVQSLSEEPLIKVESELN